MVDLTKYQAILLRSICEFFPFALSSPTLPIPWSWHTRSKSTGTCFMAFRPLLGTMFLQESACSHTKSNSLSTSPVKAVRKMWERQQSLGARILQKSKSVEHRTLLYCTTLSPSILKLQDFFLFYLMTTAHGRKIQSPTGFASTSCAITMTWVKFIYFSYASSKTNLGSWRWMELHLTTFLKTKVILTGTSFKSCRNNLHTAWSAFSIILWPTSSKCTSGILRHL